MDLLHVDKIIQISSFKVRETFIRVLALKLEPIYVWSDSVVFPERGHLNGNHIDVPSLPRHNPTPHRSRRLSRRRPARVGLGSALHDRPEGRDNEKERTVQKLLVLCANANATGPRYVLYAPKVIKVLTTLR